MKTIVVSAVNLRKGGTLTILRQCLEYLSGLAANGDYRIVAIVHKRALADYPNIEYIEMPHVIKSWLRRLWCEYVTMHTLSKQLAPIDLWLSLHDTTPRVVAKRRAVYCQTSFPFLKFRLSDLKYDYKTVLFSCFTRYAYLINIQKNDYLIVQAEWLRKGFSKMFHFPEKKMIVAPPERKALPLDIEASETKRLYTFMYAATPDCHKNFECLCRAAELLEKEIGKDRFRVVLTISGKECRYATYLWNTFGAKVDSLQFVGFLKKEALYTLYQDADCLVFPSRIETWGLPISEFSVTDKPMLLANLPYAHETASGCKQVSFFDVDSPKALMGQMKKLVNGDSSFLQEQKEVVPEKPVCYTWNDLFFLLTQSNI